MIQKLKEREKRALFLLAIVVSVYVVWTFGMDPLIEQRRMFDERIYKEKLRLKKAKAILDEKSLTPPLSITSIETHILIEEFYRMAKKSKITINNLRSSKGKKELFIEGDMEEIAHFIQSIEESKYIIGIKVMRISPKMDDPRILNVYFKIEYLQKEVQ